MKKLLGSLLMVAVLLFAVNPLNNVEATTQVENGVYSTEGFYTLSQFIKLSTPDKVKVLTKSDTVIVLGTVLYKASDVLIASDSQLPNLAINVADYTTEDGHKLVSGEKIGSVSSFEVTSIE